MIQVCRRALGDSEPAGRLSAFMFFDFPGYDYLGRRVASGIQFRTHIHKCVCACHTSSPGQSLHFLFHLRVPSSRNIACIIRRSQVHGITTLANEASGVTGSSQGRLTVYLLNSCGLYKQYCFLTPSPFAFQFAQGCCRF